MLPTLLLALVVQGPSPAPVRPVLVELFTSEGCSSCPPADDALAELVAQQPLPGIEVVALGEHVTYWNDLGWADPFSHPQFDARQAAYGHRSYTPQMVVDGAAFFVGGRSRAIEAISARRSAARLEVALKVVRTPTGLMVSAEAPGTAPLWLALTESGLSTAVPSGENAGHTLRHAPVVRRLERATRGATVAWVLPKGTSLDRLKVVAFVQEEPLGEVLGLATARP